jgi:hypothetical protein
VIEREPLASLELPAFDGRDIAPLGEVRVLNGSASHARCFHPARTADEVLGRLVANALPGDKHDRAALRRRPAPGAALSNAVIRAGEHLPMLRRAVAARLMAQQERKCSFLKKRTKKLLGTSNNRSFSGFVDGFGWRR